MEKKRINCTICKKPFWTEQYIQTEGILKGHKIIKSTTCSDICNIKEEEWLEKAMRE